MLGEAIDALGGGERPGSFAQFSAAIDPQWIADALAATGTASVRRRELPAEHVVWVAIGTGLLRDRSIAQVVHHLDLVLATAGVGRQHVTNAAIVQARTELGAAPLAALFTQTATTCGSRTRNGCRGAPDDTSTANSGRQFDRLDPVSAATLSATIGDKGLSSTTSLTTTRPPGGYNTLVRGVGWGRHCTSPLTRSTTGSSGSPKVNVTRQYGTTGSIRNVVVLQGGAGDTRVDASGVRAAYERSRS